MAEKQFKAALQYAGLGYRVFPVGPNKRPMKDSHGCHDATDDPEQLRNWFAETDHNVAIATAGLAVVDCDPDSGPWLQDHPEYLAEFEQGAVAVTPRGGRHYLFRQNGHPIRCSTSTFAPGIDIRSDGGYLCV